MEQSDTTNDLIWDVLLEAQKTSKHHVELTFDGLLKAKAMPEKEVYDTFNESAG